MSTYLTIVFKLHSINHSCILSFVIIVSQSSILNYSIKPESSFFNIFIQSIIFILFLMEPSPWVPVKVLVLIESFMPLESSLTTFQHNYIIYHYFFNHSIYRVGHSMVNIITIHYLFICHQSIQTCFQAIQIMS